MKLSTAKSKSASVPSRKRHDVDTTTCEQEHLVPFQIKDPPHTLAIDVGGTGLKASVLNRRGKMVVKEVRIKTPYPCPPEILVQSLVTLAKLFPSFDRISVGFPGVVRDGKIITAPHFGNKIWKGFKLAATIQKYFKKPVRILNDADMQGLAAIRGKGLELVVTLGTGMGTALFRSGQLMAHLELAHHPVYHDQTYNEYIGDKARKKIGNKKWNLRLKQVLEILERLVNYDELYLGGGNAERIRFKLGPHMHKVPNRNGILGGIALWSK